MRAIMVEMYRIWTDRAAGLILIDSETSDKIVFALEQLVGVCRRFEAKIQQSIGSPVLVVDDTLQDIVRVITVLVELDEHARDLERVFNSYRH
jgi:type IV secretory pathway ATPase VirB11/archaellum biosynthesis ATPase